MTDHPILFSRPMIRALLDGSKTQTRRVLRHQMPLVTSTVVNGRSVILRNQQTGARQDAPLLADVGDRLWVRETWRPVHSGDFTQGAQYRADHPDDWRDDTKWKPGIHMFRWASRLTLTVTDVRVQRVQDISDRGAQNDCIAEGMFARDFLTTKGEWLERGFSSIERCRFHDLWDSLNAKRSFGWDVNPWVVAYTFTLSRSNIDAGSS